jgi:hypothetical protein
VVDTLAFSCVNYICAPIAQRTEHRSSEPRVVGSNPSRRVSESSLSQQNKLLLPHGPYGTGGELSFSNLWVDVIGQKHRSNPISHYSRVLKFPMISRDMV